MAIICDEAWLPSPDGGSSVRRVYRDGEVIGRVRRWQHSVSSDLVREWFAAEKIRGGAVYAVINGVLATFEDGVENVVLNDAAGGVGV